MISSKPEIYPKIHHKGKDFNQVAILESDDINQVSNWPFSLVISKLFLIIYPIVDHKKIPITMQFLKIRSGRHLLQRKWKAGSYTPGTPTSNSTGSQTKNLLRKRWWTPFWVQWWSIINTFWRYFRPGGSLQLLRYLSYSKNRYSMKIKWFIVIGPGVYWQWILVMANRYGGTNLPPKIVTKRAK